MKKINEPITRSHENAWGGHADMTTQQFLVQEEDVGKLRPNYLGMWYKDYTFTKKDVDRRISVMTSPTDRTYTNWVFISP